MLGTSDRIGEALALRKCDIDDSRAAAKLPMRVTVAGTLVVIKGKGVYRQPFPKTRCCWSKVRVLVHAGSLCATDSPSSATRIPSEQGGLWPLRRQKGWPVRDVDVPAR